MPCAAPAAVSWCRQGCRRLRAGAGAPRTFLSSERRLATFQVRMAEVGPSLGGGRMAALNTGSTACTSVRH